MKANIVVIMLIICFVPLNMRRHVAVRWVYKEGRASFSLSLLAGGVGAWCEMGLCLGVLVVTCGDL